MTVIDKKQNIVQRRPVPGQSAPSITEPALYNHARRKSIWMPSDCNGHVRRYLFRRCLPIYHASCCSSSETKRSNGIRRKYSSSGWQLILKSWRRRQRRPEISRMSDCVFISGKHRGGGEQRSAGWSPNPAQTRLINWSPVWRSPGRSSRFLLLHSRRWSRDSPHAMTSSMRALQSRLSGIKTENEGDFEMSC